MYLSLDMQPINEMSLASYILCMHAWVAELYMPNMVLSTVSRIVSYSAVIQLQLYSLMLKVHGHLH